MPPLVQSHVLGLCATFTVSGVAREPHFMIEKNGTNGGASHPFLRIVNGDNGNGNVNVMLVLVLNLLSGERIPS